MPDAYWNGQIGARIRSDLGEKITKDVLNIDVLNNAQDEKFVSITDLYFHLLKKGESPAQIADTLKPYWEPKGLTPGSKCWFLTRCTNVGKNHLTKFCAVKTNKYNSDVKLGQTYVYSTATEDPNKKAFLSTLLFKTPYECSLNLSEILEVASFGKQTNLQVLKDQGLIELRDISQRDFKISYNSSEKQFIYQSVNGKEISGSKSPLVTTQFPIGEIVSEMDGTSLFYLKLTVDEKQYLTKMYSADKIQQIRLNFKKEMESYF